MLRHMLSAVLPLRVLWLQAGGRVGKGLDTGSGLLRGCQRRRPQARVPSHARHTAHKGRLSPHVVPAAWRLLSHPRLMTGPPPLAAQRPPAWAPHFLSPSSCAHTQGGGEIERWPCVQGTPVGSWPPTPWSEARCGQLCAATSRQLMVEGLAVEQPGVALAGPLAHWGPSPLACGFLQQRCALVALQGCVALRPLSARHTVRRRFSDRESYAGKRERGAEERR